MTNDTMTTSETSDLDVGNEPTPTNIVPNAPSQKKKICKSQNPVLDVVSVMNIIDYATKTKNEICTKMSKNLSDFPTLTSKTISKCGPLTKEHLAENLLTLIKFCDVIPRSSIELSRGKEPVPSELIENLKAEIELSLEKHVKDLGKSNEFVFNTLHDQVKQLETLTSEILNNTQSSTVIPTTILPLTQETPSSISVDGSNLCVEPFVDFVPDFLSNDVCEELFQYSQSADSDFSSIGQRSTLYFGECDYEYTGKVHKAKEPPEPIKKVMDMINAKYPTKVINSCLVSKYQDDVDFCPPHSDDEDQIAPESNIYTISTGAARKMAFHPISPNGEETELNLTPGSLVVFSRQSQEAWKHSIPVSTEACSARFSFTFRLVGPHFANSTLICGDSNTTKMKFGSDKGTFGRWMPGRHIPTYTVDQIPGPSEIGPYKNIVLHVGINDIRKNYEGQKSIDKHLGTLEKKCQSLLNSYPKAKIFICPILPTKDMGKVQRVHLMNKGISRLSDKYSNIVLMENYYQIFLGETETLSPRLGRYYQGAPNERDDVHLGNAGIRLLARCIKHCVLKRKGSVRNFGQGLNHVDINVRSDSRDRRHSFDGNYQAAVTRRFSHGRANHD